ncbi:MAG: DUF1517 domain-containing protein [Hassallia sp.]
MFNKMMGRTRYVVCHIILHLGGSEVAPILGVLNHAAPRQEAIDSEPDIIDVWGEGLKEICETLLRYDEYWVSVTNQGEVYWDETDAAQYVDELFTDSAQRYGSGIELNSDNDYNQPLSIPVTRNVVVMLTVVYKGEVPELETDLSNIAALKQGLKALIQLHYQHKLLGVYLHFSPSRLGEEVTNDDLLQHYPELIPL